MPDDPARRHSIRLPGYDYAQGGVYFMTACTHRRECLFGQVVGDVMQLNPLGEIVKASWEDLPRHYPHVELDAFVVMPNHIHRIIVLHDSDNTNLAVGAGLRPAHLTLPLPKGHGLPEIMRALKSFSARRVNDLRATPGNALWQRNYYEHIIRNETSCNAIRQYIQANPVQWALDRENPLNLR